MGVTHRTGQCICVFIRLWGLWQPESLVLDGVCPELLCLCHCEARPLQPEAFPKGDVLTLQVGTACWELGSLIKIIGTCSVNYGGQELFPE